MRKMSLVLPFFLLLFTCTQVPVSGRRQLQLVPESELLQLSSESYAQVKDSIPVVTGTPQSNLVQRVGQNLRTAVEKYLQDQNSSDRIKDFKWEYNLFQDTVVNAWAMPGALVGVNTGILPVTRDELGLAVVMGHEIAHAVAHHGNERMSQLLLVELGGMALSEALSKQPQTTQQLALVAFGLGAQLGIVLPYSRLQESEADQLGMIFMAMAGYDPRAAVAFWERMAAQQNQGQPPEFLSTHPSYDERLKNLEKYLPEAMKYYNGQQTS